MLLAIIPVAAASPVEIDLNTAERLALESSAGIMNAREQIQLAILQNKLNLRGFLPSLDISFNSNRIVKLHSADSNSLQLGFNISQPIFDGGRSLEALRLAEIQLNLQSAALENSIEELRDTVWQLFHGILLNKEKFKLQKELLEISIEQLIVTAKKYEMGALTELDYLEAAIEVREMELDIMETETEAEGLTQDFAALLGFDYHFFEEDPLELSGSLDREYRGLQLWAEDREMWEQIALNDNLELKGKRVELEQIKTEYEISKRAFIPSISLKANLSFSGSRFPLQEPGGSLSLGFDFPNKPAPAGLTIGSGFRDSEQISRSGGSELSVLPELGFIVDEETAKLQLRQTAESIENAETALSRNIRNSLKLLEQRRLRISVLRKTQELQRKRLEILEKRNALGEVTESELLRARVEYYGRETDLLEDVMELIQSERAFEKLIGTEFGGLEEISNNIRKQW